jgi:type IV fimbrial biogenesis protein FimT
MGYQSRLASAACADRQRVRCSGFTLVELLVTISIAAILMGVAIPSFGTFVAAQRIKTTSFDLTSALIYARSEALKRNANVTLTSATGGWQNGWTLNAGTTAINRHEPLTGMAVTGPTAALTYRSNGRPTTSGNTFSISSANNAATPSRCISVALSGIPVSKAGSC